MNMKKKSLRHASLFTGIGGFDLAASRMGWDNVFQCEIDPFCQKVLKHHFPQCALFTDIKTSKFDRYYGTIDVISGGFPCQPFSVAGKRRGTDDNRYLWPEMLRAIREVQPLWVVAENVGGILTMQSGMVFERVCADMEDAGYAVQPFVVPACAVGAPHRRDRVWIVAHAEGGGDTGESAKFRKTDGRQVGQMLSEFKFADDIRQTFTHTDLVHATGQGYGQAGCANGTHQSERNVVDNGAALRSCEKRDASDAAGTGLSATPLVGSMERGRFMLDNSRNTWDSFPTQPPVCGRDDGVSLPLDGITFSKWRNESIKAFGNAIVPQVAFRIFKAIETIESLQPKNNEAIKEN